VTQPTPSSMYGRADDKALALNAAVDLMGDRFDKIACANGDVAAAQRVTEVADVFVAWLRRLASAKLGAPTTEEIP
jgi:hypothetical protein